MRLRDFGSDKPDWRAVKFTELTDAMSRRVQGVFGTGEYAGNRDRRTPHPRGGELTAREIDAYTELVGVYGARASPGSRFNDVSKGRDGHAVADVKNLSDAALKEIVERSGAKSGDLMFFGAARPRW